MLDALTVWNTITMLDALTVWNTITSVCVRCFPWYYYLFKHYNLSIIFPMKLLLARGNDNDNDLEI